MKIPEISKSDIEYLIFAVSAFLSVIGIIIECLESNNLLILFVIAFSSFLMMILIRLDEVVSLLEGVEK